LTIVSDETVDSRVRPGSEFRAHLGESLSFGQTLVATAGTPARLVVTSKETGKDGTFRYHIAIIGLKLGLAGTLPVKPESPVVERVAAGMSIAATTLASVDYEQGKLRVTIPLPFKLSTEAPNGGFTPAPLRTASPIVPRRKPSRGPSPSPSPAASAEPSPAPSPASSASPATGTTSSAAPAVTAAPTPLPSPT
jgi:hypothetical protein